MSQSNEQFIAAFNQVLGIDKDVIMNQENEVQQTLEPLIDLELRSTLESFENSQTILNEAEFGYRYIKKYLQDCDTGAQVLEIGSGPCVLISQLKIDFPHLNITGIEPIGPGFDNFEDTLQQLIKKYGFNLIQTGYEDFNATRRFDFIFLVNVFEHLDDWRHFLEFVSKKLKRDGKCVILCPNYGFPYESHFGLPIVVNKKLTYLLFGKKIERYETKHGCEGLWESLNFVKWSGVKKLASRNGIEIKFNNTMLREMIKRLENDKEFAKRQQKISFIARLMLNLGIVRLFELPFLSRFHPYMFLEITINSAH